MARSGSLGSANCKRNGVRKNGRLKKGYRWAKNRKGCAILAKGKR